MENIKIIRKCPRCIGGRLFETLFDELFCLNCGYREDYKKGVDIKQQKG